MGLQCIDFIDNIMSCLHVDTAFKELVQECGSCIMIEAHSKIPNFLLWCLMVLFTQSQKYTAPTTHKALRGAFAHGKKKRLCGKRYCESFSLFIDGWVALRVSRMVHYDILLCVRRICLLTI